MGKYTLHMSLFSYTHVSPEFNKTWHTRLSDYLFVENQQYSHPKDLQRNRATFPSKSIQYHG